MPCIERQARKPAHQRYNAERRWLINKDRRVQKSSHGRWTYETLVSHQRALEVARIAIWGALQAAGVTDTDSARTLVRQLRNSPVGRVVGSLHGLSGSQALDQLRQLAAGSRAQAASGSTCVRRRRRPLVCGLEHRLGSSRAARRHRNGKSVLSRHERCRQPRETIQPAMHGCPCASGME